MMDSGQHNSISVSFCVVNEGLTWHYGAYAVVVDWVCEHIIMLV